MTSGRYLLDQMFDQRVRHALIELGYDIITVAEIGMATSDDAEIMLWAIDHQRTVITLDEHFGDWSILPLSFHHGVIRLKVNPTTSENTLNLLIPFLSENAGRDFTNCLAIVRTTGIRWINTAD